MSTLTARRPFSKARRAFQIAGAFLRMGYLTTISYPLAFAMTEFAAVVPAITFFFVALLVPRETPLVGGDYYSFVIIGLVSVRMLSAGLQGFSRELQSAINQGQLEMLLVEPVRWRLLPFAMAQWEIVMSTVSALILFLTSVVLGAQYQTSAIPMALVLLVLGVVASLGVGVLDASIKVLAKKADPILTLYTLAASLLSGALFPIYLLPDPIRIFSWVIPHTYVIQGLRRLLMVEGAELPGPSAPQAILGLVVFCLVVYPLGLWVFGRALEYGRRLGVLSGY